jgi:hypothetical protein
VPLVQPVTIVVEADGVIRAAQIVAAERGEFTGLECNPLRAKSAVGGEAGKSFSVVKKGMTGEAHASIEDFCRGSVDEWNADMIPPQGFQPGGMVQI